MMDLLMDNVTVLPGTMGGFAGLNDTGYPYQHGSAWPDSFVTSFPINTTMGSNETLPPPQYLNRYYSAISFFFYFVVVVTGLIGNIMVVLVVAKASSMHTPTNCYLVSLAIADVCVLVSSSLQNFVECFTIIDQWVFGAAGCSILIFLQYLGINASSLSITAFTVERYIAICHPMKAQTMCTVSRAKKIIIGLWVFGVCYCSPWLALTHTKERGYNDGSYITICTFKLKRKHYVVIYMADLVIFYVLPLLLTCVLYGLIARILFSSTIPATPGKSNGMTSAKKAKSSITSSRIQVTKMLAVVVGLFALLWLPYRIFVVFNSFTSTPYHDYWFLLFCRVMVFMNSAINPILYNAMSVKFRRAFKRLLSCGKHPDKAVYAHYTQVSHMPQNDHMEMR